MCWWSLIKRGCRGGEQHRSSEPGITALIAATQQLDAAGGGRDPTINPCPQFSLQGFCVLGFLVSCLLLEGKGQRDAASVAVAALKGSKEEELSFN